MKTEQKNVFLWLMVFYEVVEQGSFTAAADKLDLTKSGVSQHISRLEQHLGVQLLTRSTRSLNLTNIGEQLFKRSGELKTLLNLTIDEVSNSTQQVAGLLSITAPQALVQSAVLPAIEQLVKQFPNIKPRLIADDTNQNIIKKGIDIAIRVGEQADSELKGAKIGAHREIIVASSAYLSATKHSISLQNIYTHPFIATSWQTTNLTHQFLDDKNKVHELLLQPQFEMNSANSVMESVLMGLGIALLPDVYANKYIREGKIQHVLPNLKTKENNIYYVHAYKGNMPLIMKWFIEFLKKQLKN
ncbi:LysR family transcriptional regulator [Pseudomonas sp. HK3]